MSIEEAKEIDREELSLDDILDLYDQDDEIAGVQKNPFKFLDAYGPEDKEIFFGRDIEVDEALHHYHRRKYFALYGESGSGKSSLIQCGLRSKIAEEDAIFVLVRCHRDPFEEITYQINKIFIPAPTDNVPTLKDLLDNAAAALSRTIVLFFDQFEELFLFHPHGLRKHFAEELAGLIDSRLDVKIIFAIRQEYLAQLTELEKKVPDLFENKLWLRRMSIEDAILAVHEACTICGVRVEPGLLDLVIERLTPKSKGVELPYLQVVMDRLYRKAVEINSQAPELTHAAYQSEGELVDILSRFLEEEIEKLDDPDQGRQLLKAMITTDGTRRVMKRSEIIRGAESFGDVVSADFLDEILRKLVNSRILVEDPQHDTLELRHDVLAASVHDWISGLEKELMEIREAVATRFREYQARSMSKQALLDQNFLNYLMPYFERLKLDQATKDFVDHSRSEVRWQSRKKKRLQVSVLTGSFIVLLLFSLWNMQERAQAEKFGQELLHRELNSKSKQLVREDPRLSLLLAREALERARQENGVVPSAAEELLRNITAQIGGTVLTCTQDSVTDIAISDNGKWLAAACRDNLIVLWNLEQADKNFSPLILKGHTANVSDMDFSSDQRWLATAGRDHTVRLWNLEQGRPDLTDKVLQGHGTTVYSVDFSPDSKWLASGSGDNTIRLWDMTSEDPQASSKIITGHNSLVFRVAFSPGGHWLLSGSLDNSIRLWDFGSDGFLRAPVELIYPINSPVTILSFTPDEHWVVTGHENGSTVLWDIRSVPDKVTSRILPGHSSSITALAFSRKNKWLATASEDKSVRLWDLEKSNSGLNSYILENHTQPLTTIDFHPSGKWLATADRDGLVTIWDMQEPGSNYSELYGFKGEVSDLLFSADGKKLAAGSDDSTVRIWDFDSPALTSETITLRGHDGPITSLAFSSDGETLFSGSKDQTAKIWELSKPLLFHKPYTLSRHNGAVTALAKDHKRNILFTAGPDDPPKMWDLRRDLTPPAPMSLPGTFHRVGTLSLNTEADLLAVVDEEKIQILHVTNQGWQEMLTVSVNDGTHLTGITDASFLQNNELMSVQEGRHLIKKTLNHDTPFILYQELRTDYLTTKKNNIPAEFSTEKKNRLREIQKEINLFGNIGKSRITSVWAHNGSVAASVEHGRVVAIFDLLNKEGYSPMAIMDFDHTAYITEVALGPNGHWLALGLENGTVGLLDMRKSMLKKDIIFFQGHEGRITQVVFGPHGNWLATGGDDAVIRLWPVDISDIAESACLAAGIPITKDEWKKYVSKKEPYRNACQSLQ